MNRATCARAQDKLAFGRVHSRRPQKVRQPIRFRFMEQRSDVRPDQLGRRPAGQFGEPAVAVEHRAIGGNGRCSLVHRLYQHAVRGIATLQGYDLCSSPAEDYQSIYVPGGNRTQRFFGGFDSRKQLFLAGGSGSRRGPGVWGRPR